MTMDLTVTEYATYDDLYEYVYGSAAVIGLQMVPILEPLAPEAYDRARDLGVAFQLANFVRDVGEDLDRGRVYLPLRGPRPLRPDPRRPRTRASSTTGCAHLLPVPDRAGCDASRSAAVPASTCSHPPAARASRPPASSTAASSTRSSASTTRCSPARASLDPATAHRRGDRVCSRAQRTCALVTCPIVGVPSNAIALTSSARSTSAAATTPSRPPTASALIRSATGKHGGSTQRNRDQNVRSATDPAIRVHLDAPVDGSHDFG